MVAEPVISRKHIASFALSDCRKCHDGWPSPVAAAQTYQPPPPTPTHPPSATVRPSFSPSRSLRLRLLCLVPINRYLCSSGERHRPAWVVTRRGTPMAGASSPAAVPGDKIDDVDDVCDVCTSNGSTPIPNRTISSPSDLTERCSISHRYMYFRSLYDILLYTNHCASVHKRVYS